MTKLEINAVQGLLGIICMFLEYPPMVSFWSFLMLYFPLCPGLLLLEDDWYNAQFIKIYISFELNIHLSSFPDRHS